MDPVIVNIYDFYHSSVLAVKDAIARAKKINQKTLPVIINSPGGSVLNLFQMLDALEASGLEVVTICNGIAMSAGAVLFASGKRRYMSKRSTIMIHDLSTIAWGKQSELNSYTKTTDKWNDELYAVLDQASGKKAGYWQDKVKQNAGADLFLTAQEALTEGLATEIKVPEPGELFASTTNIFKISAEADDFEKIEAYAQFIPNQVNTLPEKPAKKIISKKEGKPVDLEELLAMLTAEQAAPVLALQALLKEAQGKVTAAENSVTEANSKVTKLETDVKNISKKYDEFVINSLVTNKKLSKADADKKIKLLEKMPAEIKDEFIEDLVASAKPVVPPEINDMGEAEQDMGDKTPEAERLKALEAIAAKNNLNLKNTQDYIKATQLYHQQNK